MATKVAYPETPEQWKVYREEMLSKTKTQRIKSNDQLTRNHPLVQLFLAARPNPERWRFWFEKGSIWAQERYKGKWFGPIIQLGWDGVWRHHGESYRQVMGSVNL